MDTEVDPRSALSEAQGTDGSNGSSVIDQPVEEELQDQVDETRDVIDIIQPKSQPKEWVLGPPDDPEQQRRYIQRELSYFGKMQFFALVGEVIDNALSGDDGLKLGNLFGTSPIVGRDGTISMSDFSEADTFVQAVGKLLVYAPDFLEKCYCIWLAIPEFERPWARAAMSKQPSEGGLSDEDGIEIIEIFIDQNWKAVESFFRDKIGSLRDRVQAHRQESESQRSKPSKGTQPVTRNE